MINLIKNELSKIMHKKTIYVMAIISFALTILVTILNNITINQFFDNPSFYETSVKQLENGKIENKEELSWLVADKNMYDSLTLIHENGYKDTSWQYHFVNNEIMNSISCMNNAKYIDKDDERYNECKKEYDNQLKLLDSGDWKKIVLKDKKAKEAELKELKAQLKSSEDDNEINELKNEISDIKIDLEGLEYHLKLDIAPSNDVNSSYIENYVQSAKMYRNMNKDETSYRQYNDLLEKRAIEKDYNIYKYRLENKILSSSKDGKETFQDLMTGELTTPLFFIIILVIMIGGTITSEEFNKGTIKQLLLKPYTRTQIIISKYLSTIIVFIGFMLYYVLMCSIIYGISTKFNGFTDTIVEYSFNSNSAIEISTFKYCILNFLAIIPEYLILMTVAFFIGSAFCSSVVSIILGFVTYFFGNIVAGILSMTTFELGKFVPMMCWNLQEFLFGGLPSFKYSTFGISLFVDILTVGILLVLSIVIFNKKDIKNQ